MATALMQNQLEFIFSQQYQGIGGSEGLDRGLLVCAEGTLLVEEGMGLGAVALQTGGFTYFASISRLRRGDVQTPFNDGLSTSGNGLTSSGDGLTSSGDGLTFSGDVMVADLNLDRRLVWKVFGRPSPLLTRLLEAFVTHGYMKHESAQPMLISFGARLTRGFHVEAHFQPVPSQGSMTVTYRTGSVDAAGAGSVDAAGAVDIDVSGHWSKPDARVFIMNELGGILFQSGLANGVLVPPPSGWQRLHGRRELYSPRFGLAFTLEELAVPQNVRSTCYWGREVTDRFCWAGFESDLQCTGESVSGYRFRIRFRNARPDGDTGIIKERQGAAQ